MAHNMLARQYTQDSTHTKQLMLTPCRQYTQLRQYTQDSTHKTVHTRQYTQDSTHKTVHTRQYTHKNKPNIGGPIMGRWIIGRGPLV